MQKNEEGIDSKSKNGSEIKDDKNNLTSDHSQEKIEILSTNKKNENVTIDPEVEKQIDAV